MFKRMMALGLCLLLCVGAAVAMAEETDEHVELMKEAEGFALEALNYPLAGETEQTYVSGKLVCEAPDAYKLMTLIRVGNLYGPKPTMKEPDTIVHEDGRFEATFATPNEGGDLECTEIYLYVLPAEYEHSVEVDEGYVVTTASADQLLKDSVMAVKIVR